MMDDELSANASGIYKIEYRPTGSFYVGSAKNIAKRWARHRDEISRGCHPNFKIRNASQYLADWKFSVIEHVCDPSRLIQREMELIAMLHPQLNVMYPTPADVDSLPAEQTTWLEGKPRFKWSRKPKRCEICGDETGRSLRYCSCCARRVLRKQEEDGYFVSVPNNSHEKYPALRNRNGEIEYFSSISDGQQSHVTWPDEETIRHLRGLLQRAYAIGDREYLFDVARLCLELPCTGASQESQAPATLAAYPLTRNPNFATRKPSKILSEAIGIEVVGRLGQLKKSELEQRKKELVELFLVAFEKQNTDAA